MAKVGSLANSLCQRQCTGSDQSIYKLKKDYEVKSSSLFHSLSPPFQKLSPDFKLPCPSGGAQ